MHKMNKNTFYAFEMQNEERTDMRICVGSFNLKSKMLQGCTLVAKGNISILRSKNIECVAHIEFAPANISNIV